jgi:hypothetical protein
MKYKVRHLINDTWEVILIIQQYTEIEEESASFLNTPIRKVYQGSLADCEAYIRLKEGGYM